jgi:hypothetical protein
MCCDDVSGTWKGVDSILKYFKVHALVDHGCTNEKGSQFPVKWGEEKKMCCGNLIVAIEIKLALFPTALHCTARQTP